MNRYGREIRKNFLVKIIADKLAMKRLRLFTLIEADLLPT